MAMRNLSREEASKAQLTARTPGPSLRDRLDQAGLLTKETFNKAKGAV